MMKNKFPYRINPINQDNFKHLNEAKEVLLDSVNDLSNEKYSLKEKNELKNLIHESYINIKLGRFLDNKFDEMLKQVL